MGEVGEGLADFAWNYRCPLFNNEPLRMLLVPLPTRYYELNPQELVFAYATNEIKTYLLSDIPMDGYVVPTLALKAFNECSAEKVLSFFRHCGYGKN